MQKSLLTTAAFILSLAACAAFAQPVGGLGSSAGPAGGVIGGGSLITNPRGAGMLGDGGMGGADSSANNLATPSSGMNSPAGSSENLGIMPYQSSLPTSMGTGMPMSPDENTLSTPDMAPSGAVVGAAPGAMSAP